MCKKIILYQVPKLMGICKPNVNVPYVLQKMRQKMRDIPSDRFTNIPVNVPWNLCNSNKLFSAYD